MPYFKAHTFDVIDVLTKTCYIYLLCTQPNIWIHFIWTLLCLRLWVCSVIRKRVFFSFWLCGHSSVVFFILLLLYILHISFTYCLRCAATVLWQRSDSFHSLLVRVTQKDKEPRRLIRKLWFVFLRYCKVFEYSSIEALRPFCCHNAGKRSNLWSIMVQKKSEKHV